MTGAVQRRAIQRRAVLASCVLSSSWLLAGGSVAYAADPPSAPAPSTSTSTTYKPVASPFSLTISPTRLVVSPQEIGQTHEILVVNRGRDALTVTVQKRDFVGKRDGSLQFETAAPFAASSWVTVEPSTFVLQPDTSRHVTATITVPKVPEPGDHQVALVFIVPAGKTSGNIKINRGIATPVYITVPGPATNTAAVSGLHAPGFAIGGPIHLTATVTDTGTVHRDFRGTDVLKVAGAGAAAFPDFTVPRGGIRDVSTTWSPPLLCICHAKVSIVNANGTTSSMTIQVIVFPLVQVAIVLGALLLLLLIMIISRRRYRKSVTRAATAMNTRASAGVG